MLLPSQWVDSTTTLTLANGLVGVLWIVLMVQSIGTRVAREERMMQEAFGDAYARYMENTGRFSPKLGQ